MDAPVLGISAFFHNSAAAIVSDGLLLAALEEERVSRIKNDASWPAHAIKLCLQDANISASDLGCMAFYERPLRSLKRANLLPPDSLPSAAAPFSSLLKITRYAREISASLPVFYFPHHLSHAASAFLPSGFAKAAVIVMDGVGETTCTSIWTASMQEIRCLQRDEYPNSFGLFYSYITNYLGFEVLQDEFKVMGLAAWGKPDLHRELQKIIRFDEDGRVRISPEWQARIVAPGHAPSRAELALLGRRRGAGDAIEQRHMDIAASLQTLFTEWLAAIVRRAKSLMPQVNKLCIAGGVAHNCRALGELQSRAPFESIFVQPAAGDAGAALGAAMLPRFLKGQWSPSTTYFDPYVGPTYSRSECLSAIESAGLRAKELAPETMTELVAEGLINGEIIGWFQGRAEFGPRALGNRSILASPLIHDIGKILNDKIKQRELFRPFAPAVLAEHADRFFAGRWIDRYMLVTGRTRTEFAEALSAVTHIDGSARVQLVDKQLNPLFHQLVSKFSDVSGIPILLNTSLNHSSEPVVLTPADALRTARLCKLDCLALGPFYLRLSHA